MHPQARMAPNRVTRTTRYPVLDPVIGINRDPFYRSR